MFTCDECWEETEEYFNGLCKTCYMLYELDIEEE